MANSDMKTIKELDTFNKEFNRDESIPIVAKDNNVDRTMNVKLGSLIAQIRGVEFAGVLTAGSTSITLSSTTQVTYDSQKDYSVGELCVNDSVVYICVVGCNAANWDTNKVNFIECPQITTNSTIKVFTDPAVLYNSIAASAGSVTIEFDAQDADIRVKVRVT